MLKKLLSILTRELKSQMKSLFKKPSSKDIYGYNDNEPSVVETSFDQIAQAIKGKKGAAAISAPSKISKVELNSLIAEWECFKMKMDAYLISQRGK